MRSNRTGLQLGLDPKLAIQRATRRHPNRTTQAEHFQETITAFGQYPGQVYYLLLYVIDNEIHHRAQGYVYLRTLGIEPAPFYERD